ncbi:hypothetical protein IW262DRAFT_1450721 [Armillaria fumosa]|nr:hypothetical protein IW262DRAFT_1450721 [Armillaria fumosa]
MTGARLSKITQSLAYKGLCARAGMTTRASTDVTLDRIATTIEEINGLGPTHENIWRSIWSYLWKSIQGTFKIGGFWDKLGPQYANRVNCPKCRVIETMEHILIDCEIEGIVMTEATHLIWKIQCQYRITRTDNEQAWHLNSEVVNLWNRMINKRLVVDRLSTNHQHHGMRAINRRLVLRTWRGTLKDEKALLEDWINHNRVLVGMEMVQR